MRGNSGTGNEDMRCSSRQASAGCICNATREHTQRQKATGKASRDLEVCLKPDQTPQLTKTPPKHIAHSPLFSCVDASDLPRLCNWAWRCMLDGVSIISTTILK